MELHEHYELSLAQSIGEYNAEHSKADTTVCFAPESGTLVFSGGHIHPIALTAIPDPLALLGWVAHLSAKTWATPQMIQAFITCVCDVKGWPLPMRD